jgi:hypothetical protein
VVELARITRKVAGVAVPGGIDGDDLETEPGQPAQHPQVCAAAQHKSVQEHQRNTLTTDRNPDLVPIIKLDNVVPQGRFACATAN